MSLGIDSYEEEYYEHQKTKKELQEEQGKVIFLKRLVKELKGSSKIAIEALEEIEKHRVQFSEIDVVLMQTIAQCALKEIVSPSN